MNYASIATEQKVFRVKHQVKRVERHSSGVLRKQMYHYHILSVSDLESTDTPLVAASKKNLADGWREGSLRTTFVVVGIRDE